MTTLAQQPLWALGFRPFFLLAGLGALLPVLSWVLLFAGVPLAEPYYGPELYHAHEMLFGYVVAVMAGFLLTAIRNWTGMPTPTGGALAGLAALWLAGRLAALAGGVLPGALLALVDLAFLPVLALVLARILWRAGNRRNLIFPVMLLAMALANLAVHLALQGVLPAAVAERVLTAGTLVAVLMVTVMAGRVFPMFTSRGVPAAAAHVRSFTGIERIAAPLVLLFIVVLLLGAESPLFPLVALVAGVVHALRFAGWYSRFVWREPLVWVLHAGYAWVAIGFLLYPLSWAGLVAHHVPLHALTAGALGTITLGMMARVALGHTGRPLAAPRPVAVAFVLLQLAALLRVAGAALWPPSLAPLVQLSGTLWTLAFVLFLFAYWPVLSRPRVDGVPG